MLNDKRVILMTRLAAYEQGDGKKNVEIGNYFRSDYLAVQILKSVICATIVYALLFALYVLYDFEVFMQDLYKIDIIAFAKDVLKYYVICVGGYTILTYIYCTYRYIRSKKSLKAYYQNLKKLNAMYGTEGSQPEATTGRTTGGRR